MLLMLTFGAFQERLAFFQWTKLLDSLAKPNEFFAINFGFLEISQDLLVRS
jgi:hypothetical protein